jgi:hypothetical protein
MSSSNRNFPLSHDSCLVQQYGYPQNKGKRGDLMKKLETYREEGDLIVSRM